MPLAQRIRSALTAQRTIQCKFVRGGTAGESSEGTGGTAKVPENGHSQSEVITVDFLTKKLQSMQSQKEREWQWVLMVNTGGDLVGPVPERERQIWSPSLREVLVT
ncbi:hypothetical protein K438DRAFT_1778150 [Mycena galopus ATCC 62051]|nr:hypothetical protein K438DRAFT_1778150 [Mycena galopus ATCC 62051]